MISFSQQQSKPFAFEHLLRGAFEIEHTPRGLLPHRLPSWVMSQSNDDNLAMAESQPSGVYLMFLTEAMNVELDVLPTRYVYVGAPPRPAGIFDFLIDGHLARQASATSSNLVTLDIATGATSRQAGVPCTLRFHGLPVGRKQIQIWLPHNETAELISLRADDLVEPVTADVRKRWMHHGSSISQGSNASSPSSTWPAVAAALGNVELLNLGFGGSALLDPFTARVMRDTPADFISLKVGINLVNMDLMRMRAFTAALHGFLDTLRDGHADTPLLVMSPIYCPIHENTPGPGAFDLGALAEGTVKFRATGKSEERRAGKLTLDSIRTELHRVVGQRALQDPNLCYVDGLALYGPSDFAIHPLPDALHPDTYSHRLIGERFAELAFGSKGPFTSAP